MSDDISDFNMSMRKFLKQVGVTSQQAIEEGLREAGDLEGREFKAKVVLTVEGLGYRTRSDRCHQRTRLTVALTRESVLEALKADYRSCKRIRYCLSRNHTWPQRRFWRGALCAGD